ncbi:MAG: GTP-binding protein, partial [Candidatus Tumulicola sp.]
MKPIPVAVIGGYLGAGKTTLLNALLRNANGLRYAVLVNDFGSVNIDGEMIASSGTRAIELTNGCMCCTIGGDLILALQELVTRDAVPERIVIEASGVADPRAIARLAACHPALYVQGTVVIADAETIVD